jgi:pyruvate,water dikinase
MKRFYQVIVILCICTAIISALSLLAFKKIFHPPVPFAPTGSQTHALNIRNFSEFKSLQGAPLTDKFNDVLSVKVVYDLHDELLYFINSSRYRYHYDFAEKVLLNEEPLEVFNMLNYGNTLKRQYILANINYYQQSHIYTLEFSSEDQATPQQITGLFNQVCNRSYLKDSLRLLIGSERFVALDNDGKLPLPKVYPSAIYHNQKFQALNTGVCYGILRDGTKQENNYSPGDIVVVRGTPVNVPVCAGIITNSYQTPLSHINILCHNRNIPSAVQTTAFDDTGITRYFGKPVYMSVSASGLTVKPTTQRLADSFKKAHTSGAVVTLHFDTTVKSLLPVSSFNLRQKDVVGNKAAGLGELYAITQKSSANFKIPEGAFAIPFYFYYKHVSNVAIRWKINDLIAMQKQNAPEAKIKEQLKLVRKAIKEQPLDPELLSAVTSAMKANGFTSYRFRSSANAEDVAGFSGAGLYESKTGKLNDKDKPVDDAIKKVWASVYDDNAYFERVAANIDEHTIVMGILAHRNFPDEIANGVAITKNIYRNGFPGFTVNVQKGEVPVVSPPDSVTCEQFICMAASEINPLDVGIATDYITYSNINNNKPVLTRQQVTALYYALSLVRDHYTNSLRLNPEMVEKPMDVEFKFDKNGKLYLKQARPYR